MSSSRANTPVTRFRFFDSGVLFFDSKLTADGWVDTVYPTPRKKKAGKKTGKLAAMWKKHLSCQ